MAIFFKCPICVDIFMDEQGEHSYDYELDEYECPACGSIVTLDNVID